MKLNELIKENEYITSGIDLSASVGSLATTPEKTGERSLFVLENPKKMPSINDFPVLPVAILSSEDAPFPSCIPSIKVKNARLASSFIHSRFYGVDFSEFSIIGVTGTNGKTSTAYMIYKILEDNNIKAGFIGTGMIEILGQRISDFTYSMTTPDPNKLYKVLKKMQDEGCTRVVMEVSSHALALDKVAPIPFEYGVFTNLSPEHTDFHKTMDDYFEAKLKLLKSSKKCIINIDDRYGRLAANILKNNTTTIGAIWRGDYYATNIETQTYDGISYFTHNGKICYKTTLAFPGIYNVYNSLLASAACIEMGIAPCKVKRSLASLRGISGRFEVIKSKIKVIIDYAHTEAAYKNILEDLKRFKKSKCLTVVFGCGGERDRTKRERIAALVESYADRIIVTEDNSRNERPEQIIADIKKGFKQDGYRIIYDRKTAISEAILNSSEGDVVAIIGKGAEEYNLDGEGYHPFSDKDVIFTVLKEYENKA